MDITSHPLEIIVVKQISVDLKNEPGALATIMEGLKRASASVLGISADTGKGVTRVHFVVGHPEAAILVLTEMGENVSVKEVLSITIVERKGGELTQITRKLADNQMNIDSIYVTSAEKGTHPTVYLSCSNAGVHTVKALLTSLH